MGTVGRVVVCGEALIDLVSTPAPTDDSFVSTWGAQSAGGPMNSAIALARLGQPVEFLGRLSTDRFGEQLRLHLEADEVGLTLATVVDDPTSVAVVSLDDQRKASYAFHFAGTANFGWTREELPVLGPTDWLHIASLATIVAPGAAVLAAWVEQTSARLSYDVNVRSSVIADPREYWATIEPFVAAVGARSGVLKASDDDLAFLAPALAADGPDALAEALMRRYSPGLLVMTRGADGAVALLPDGGQVSVPGHSVELVDTVGAGDTFMAGLLSRLLQPGHDTSAEGVRDALQWGAAASAIVCARSGAQPPSRLEVEEYLGLAL